MPKKRVKCPFCGSTNTMKFGFAFDDKTGRICNSCGGGFNPENNYTSEEIYKLGQMDWTFSRKKGSSKGKRRGDGDDFFG